MGAFKRAFFFLGVFLLSGCSTTVILVEEGEEFSVLKGKNVKRSLCNWEETAIRKVDGKIVAALNGAPVTYSDFSAHVSPGEHKVELMALYNFCSWPQEVYTELTFNTEPNKIYHPEMEIDNGIVSMWLVDSDTGEVVSEKTTPQQAKGKVLIIPM